jgi:hypothetical protein
MTDSGSGQAWGILAPVHRLATAIVFGSGLGCVYGLTDLDPSDGLPSDTGLPTGETQVTSDTGEWVTFDTQDTDSTDTDTDTDTNTGGTSAGTHKPSIDSFSAAEEITDVRFSFTVTDQDNDMDGGWATLEVGSTSQTYRWPQDLDMTSDTRGSTTWLLSAFAPEIAETVRLTVEDSTGRTDTESTSFTRSIATYTATENGDDLMSAVNLGEIQVPAEISGSIHSCGNAGGGYSADTDMVRFTVSSSRKYQMELTWSDAGISDLDLYLLDNATNELGRSTTIFHPEQIAYDLNTGTSYQLFVGCWTGTPGSWTVRIQVL